MHNAEAWVLVDGHLRHRRRAFCRESGPEAINLPLRDQDRFMVLAVTDAGGDTAYDWVAFGDAVIEMMTVEGISTDDNSTREGRETDEYNDGVDTTRQREVGSHGTSYQADAVAVMRERDASSNVRSSKENTERLHLAQLP
jgi:hypothetical protein